MSSKSSYKLDSFKLIYVTTLDKRFKNKFKAYVNRT